ncbi:MAG: hypothetical protein HYT31_00775 [Parcubacteria group bacterium]|nr:hypothetical protein [Parcubacteria group bacterium]
MRKTIFITITRSFITRNILRCGVLDLLKKKGYSVFVFFPAKKIPAYLKDEFEDDQVTLVPVQVASTRLHRIFTKFSFRYLLLSKSAKHSAFDFNENAKTRFASKKFLKQTKIIPWLRYLYLILMSKSTTIKHLYRFIEQKFFAQKHPQIQFYFDTYKPNIALSTSFVSYLDTSFIKEAKRRRIPVVSMPKSWDNITVGYMQFLPDYFIVPNKPSRDAGVYLQNIPARRVRIVGIPQFDWYVREDIIKSREEHFKKKGLDPALPLIFFGSEGVWATRDHEVAEMIYGWMTNNELTKPCQLVVRAHYTNAYMDIFKKLRNKKGVAVDDYRIVDFMPDRWDPDKEEIIDFVNTLYHCDIMINAASTLTLDAACFDKPIINIGFGCVYEDGDRNGKDITSTMYDSDHFTWVLETEATTKVDTPAALKEAIDGYLHNPTHKAQERALLREKLCYKVDGKSSRRMVDYLDEILEDGSRKRLPA